MKKNRPAIFESRVYEPLEYSLVSKYATYLDELHDKIYRFPESDQFGLFRAPTAIEDMFMDILEEVGHEGPLRAMMVRSDESETGLRHFGNCIAFTPTNNSDTAIFLLFRSRNILPKTPVCQPYEPSQLLPLVFFHFRLSRQYY